MLNNPESIVFVIGAVIMLVFAVLFFISRKHNSYFTAAFLVSSVTLVSYLVMLEGSLAGVYSSGNFVYYSRWLFYIGSCSILMLSIAKLLDLPRKNLLPVIILNVLVMLSGAIAAVLTDEFKWILFGAGTLFFIGQLFLLFENSKPGKTRAMVIYYIIFGWAIFPIVFFLAPEGLGLISNLWAVSIYLALDIFTKIVFYLHLDLVVTKKKPAIEKSKP